MKELSSSSEDYEPLRKYERQPLQPGQIRRGVPLTEEEVAIEQEAADTELKVAECFELLQRAKSKSFRRLVEDLYDLHYLDEKAGGSEYCQALGMCVAELTNHPKILGDKKRVLALEYILGQSLDDDVKWYVAGVAIDFDIKGGEIWLKDVHDTTLSCAQLSGVTLFSPEFTLQGGGKIALTGRMTPAWVFKAQSKEGVERKVLPLIHTDSMFEDIDLPPDADSRERYLAYCAMYPKYEGVLEEMFSINEISLGDQDGQPSAKDRMET